MRKLLLTLALVAPLTIAGEPPSDVNKYQTYVTIHESTLHFMKSGMVAKVCENRPAQCSEDMFSMLEMQAEQVIYLHEALEACDGWCSVPSREYD